MKSIRTKILTMVLSSLLVITVLVSIIAVNMTHEIMHKDADRILNNATQKEAAYLNDILGDISKSATIMEHYALLEIRSVEDLADPAFLDRYLKKTREMFQEIALNTTGFMGYFLRINPEYADSTTGYYNLISEDGVVTDMPVTDLSKYPENDERNASWYYTAVREGKPVWLKPYYYPGHNKQMISYTVPMYIGSELLGVLGFDMDFEYLVEKINQISVYEEGYAILLSSDGQRYNQIGREDSHEEFATASASLKNGMTLELRADYKDIQRDSRYLLTQIVLAFVLVLAVSVAYTVFTTNKIVQPLKRLTAATEKIADGGNTEVELVYVDTKDEIGRLSVVLRTAYEKIQEYTTYINALAYKDSLTGLKNSTAYTEVIAKLNHEINYGSPRFGVLVADMNNLKQTNDRYGHDVGNELIIRTAKVIEDTLQNSTVFRVGGDEFVAILTERDVENYRTAMERLDKACLHAYVEVGENKISVSLARGVALFDPETDHVYRDVFSKADHAMYLHKEQIKAASV